ncbi:MAG: hypothetical protein Q9M27_00180 [Mariprofundaceae bacterium]|nr:hypothetical protein [Mariprofundaceae bacterium]
MTTASFQFSWWTRGDLDGFSGLFRFRASGECWRACGCVVLA